MWLTTYKRGPRQIKWECIYIWFKDISIIWVFEESTKITYPENLNFLHNFVLERFFLHRILQFYVWELSLILLEWKFGYKFFKLTSFRIENNQSNHFEPPKKVTKWPNIDFIQTNFSIYDFDIDYWFNFINWFLMCFIYIIHFFSRKSSLERLMWIKFQKFGNDLAMLIAHFCLQC